MDPKLLAKHIDNEMTRFILAYRADIEKDVAPENNKHLLTQNLAHFEMTKEQQKLNVKKAFCTIGVEVKYMIAYLFTKYVNELSQLDNAASIDTIVCTEADMNLINKMHDTEAARATAATICLLGKQMKFIADETNSRVDLCSALWMYNVVSTCKISPASKAYTIADPDFYFNKKIEQSLQQIKSPTFIRVADALFTTFLKCMCKYISTNVWETSSTVNRGLLCAAFRMFDVPDELMDEAIASIPEPKPSKKKDSTETTESATGATSTTSTVATTTTSTVATGATASAAGTTPATADTSTASIAAAVAAIK